MMKMFDVFFKKRHAAGVLAYTIFLSIVGAVLLLTLFVALRYVMIEAVAHDRRVDLIYELTSVESQYLVNGSGLSYRNHENVRLIEGEPSDFLLKKERWGLFDLVKFQSSTHPRIQSQALLGSSFTNQPFNSSLYLADLDGPLSLVGDTKITGNVYLPPAGIRSAFINRIGYTNKDLLAGGSFDSEPVLFDLPAYYTYSKIRAYHTSQRMRRFMPKKRQEVVENRFSSDTTLVVDDLDKVRDRVLKGRIVIDEHNQAVALDSSFNLEDIVIFCKSIRIKAGFNGSLQVFARDSILIDSGAVLLYPSILFAENGFEPVTVIMDSHARLSGGIIINGKGDNLNIRYLNIGADALVEGLIYVHGVSEVFGRIVGHISTTKFIVNDFTGVYENFLMNAEITNDLSGHNIGMPALGGSLKNQELVKWVN